MSNAKATFYPTNIEDRKAIEVLQGIWNKMAETVPGKYMPHHGDIVAAKRAERERRKHLQLGTSAWLWEAALTARGLTLPGMHLLPHDMSMTRDQGDVIPFDLLRLAAERRVKGLSTEYLLANENINLETDIKPGERISEICIGFADRDFMSVGHADSKVFQRDEPVYASVVFSDQLKLEKLKEVRENPKRFAYAIPAHVSLEGSRAADKAAKKMIAHYGKTLLIASKTMDYVTAIGKSMKEPYKDCYESLKSFREHYSALSKSSSMVGAMLSQGVRVATTSMRAIKAAKITVVTASIVVAGMAAAAHALHIPLPAHSLNTLMTETFSRATGVAGAFGNFLTNVGHNFETFLGSVEHAAKGEISEAGKHVSESHVQMAPHAPLHEHNVVDHVSRVAPSVHEQVSKEHVTAVLSVSHEHMKEVDQVAKQHENEVTAVYKDEPQVVSSEKHEYHHVVRAEHQDHVRLAELEKKELHEHAEIKQAPVDKEVPIGRHTQPDQAALDQGTLNAIKQDIDSLKLTYPSDHYSLAESGTFHGEVVKVNSDLGIFYVRDDHGGNIHAMFNYRLAERYDDLEESKATFHVGHNHVVDKLVPDRTLGSNEGQMERG